MTLLEKKGGYQGRQYIRTNQRYSRNKPNQRKKTENEIQSMTFNQVQFILNLA